MNNFIVIDPDLKSKNLGHFFNYDVSVYNAFKDDFNVKIYTSHLFNIGGKEDYFFPAIRTNSKKSWIGKFLGILINQISLLRLLMAKFIDRSSKIIFLPNFDIPLFFPLIFALSFLRNDKKLFIFYRYSIESKFANTFTFKWFYRVIFNFNSKNIIWITDSELLRIEALSFFGKNLHVVPIPHVPNNLTHFNGNKSDIPVLYIPGRLLPGKSFGKIVENFFESDLKLKIQAEYSELKSDFPKQFELINNAINDGRLILLPKFLEQGLLMHEMNNSDIIFLPYKSVGYEKQTSGFFSEALGMGKIVIVGSNTWMSFILNSTRAAGEIIDIDNISTFNEAVNKILSDFNNYNNQANVFSKEWCSYHSEVNFSRELLAR